MKLTPRLPHCVWSATPLSGGAPSGLAKPAPRVPWNGPRCACLGFHASPVAPRAVERLIP